jgi:hypothetical protein
VCLYHNKFACQKAGSAMTTSHRTDKQKRQKVFFGEVSRSRSVAVEASAVAALKEFCDHERFEELAALDRQNMNRCAIVVKSRLASGKRVPRLGKFGSCRRTAKAWGRFWLDDVKLKAIETGEGNPRKSRSPTTFRNHAARLRE